MKKSNIFVLSAELEKWSNKNSGEITEMTKIYYAIKMSNSDNKVGYSVLKCYKRGNHLKYFDEIIMKSVVADIEERATDNGSKYVLLNINGKEIV